MEALIKNVPHAQPFALSQQVDYQPGKVVSLTLAQQPGVGITLFAFDAGEAISTHAAGGAPWPLCWRAPPGSPLTACPIP